MAYFKKLEVDESEVKKLRAECVSSRMLIGQIARSLATMDARLKRAAVFLDELEFRTRYAEEVDPYED